MVFRLASVSELSNSFSSIGYRHYSPHLLASFHYTSESSRPVFRIEDNREFNKVLFFTCTILTLQVFKLNSLNALCVDTEKNYARAVSIEFKTEEESRVFHSVFEQLKNEANGNGSNSRNKFDEKIDTTSAKMYFEYYGKLLHQHNMLQDHVKTGTYYAAILHNKVDFAGRVVLDVGAGTGVLSLFAAQAGARHVYAVEASEMAEYARQLISGNGQLAQRITVLKGKIEEVVLPEKVDILISEPMGTLLVDERMLESYVIARDRFLVPNGKMFPNTGSINMAPFSDEQLYAEIANKAFFWQQQDYYGIDSRPLHENAFKGIFSKPVLDAFDPRLLVAPSISHVLDFTSIKEEDLYDINIPLHFIASTSCRVHGLACWFDVSFDGSIIQRLLTTAPNAPTTHWYQIRCVLPQPLYVLPGQEIMGQLHLIAHSNQSYTMELTMSSKLLGPEDMHGGILLTSSCKLDLRDPYYRVFQPPQTYPSSMSQHSDQLPDTQVNKNRAHAPQPNSRHNFIKFF